MVKALVKPSGDELIRVDDLMAVVEVKDVKDNGMVMS
jgi:hypothetical protein